MIKSWKNRDSQRLYEEGRGTKFRGMEADTAQELLVVLNAATSLTDLSPLKSIGLHKLKGDRKKQWAMTINGPWRVCFRFHDGDAYDVEITNYH